MPAAFAAIPPKPKCRCDQGDDEEDDGVAQHDDLPESCGTEDACSFNLRPCPRGRP